MRCGRLPLSKDPSTHLAVRVNDTTSLTPKVKEEIVTHWEMLSELVDEYIHSRTIWRICQMIKELNENSTDWQINRVLQMCATIVII